MTDVLLAAATADTVPLTLITKAAYEAWLSGAHAATQRWLAATAYKAEPGSIALLPGKDGGLAGVLVGVTAGLGLWDLAGLPRELALGRYQIAEVAGATLDAAAAGRLALGWALGSYAFTRYRKAPRAPASLVWPEGADQAEVTAMAAATTLVRDLINTPANDLGPAELAAAALKLAETFGAKAGVLVGDDLLAENYPAIHAVGRGSAPARAPRLIDFTWGSAKAPKVTLVGKGVVFDTGGLDIKPSSGMLTMKKDMGGAAHVLGLAHLIMALKLPVRLRVLIPAVENSISGDAYRPSDILKTRLGLTVEVGNTDAEGRLVLCDALAEASAEAPALLLDFATLTGAARVALGPELAAMFSNDNVLAADLEKVSQASEDPLWRLPLWQPYAKGLDSKIADVNNVASHAFAGAIIAALFLEKFVGPGIPWAHFDVMAWNGSAKPGRPEGGEALGLRAVFALLKARFGSL